jgi:Domain of unknown function (DUF4440)
MSLEDELLELERSGWKALASDGPSAAEFYRRVLAARILFILPGGIVSDDREEMVSAVGGAPWDAYELSDERVEPLGVDAAVVAYRARARRAGNDYDAWFTSTYRREADGWRLALHQQTPV